MPFKEFCSKLFYPAIITIVGFLALQYTTSFVSQAEFSTHKIEQAAILGNLGAKLDFIIEQQKEIKDILKGKRWGR